MDNRALKVTCPKCRSQVINSPDDFDFDHNFVGVSCAACGRGISINDVIKQAAALAKKQVNDLARKQVDDLLWGAVNGFK